MITPELKALIDRLDTACRLLSEAVNRQWRGDAAFRLSIPARPDADADLLIGAALHDAKAALLALAASSQGEPREPEEEVVYRVNVFREEDGRFAAEFTTGDGMTAGMGNYAASPVGALAELCATLIKCQADGGLPAVPAQPSQDDSGKTI